jgi:hypothetical protein
MIPLSRTFFQRIHGNLKGSQVTTLFASVDKEGKIQDDHNGEEGQALMSLEESTEMTSVVTKTD